MSDQTLPEVVDKSGDITDIVVGSWNEMQRMAKAFAASALVPDHLKNKPTDVLVILQTAKELDIPPMQGISGINVIKGKPSISPELQLALIRSRVPQCFIKIDVNNEKRSVSCTMARSSSPEDMAQSFTSVWDMERATAMGLAGNHNYKSQPQTMLKWRCIGEAARTVFPDITRGLYNTEEAFDMGGPHDSKPSPSFKEIFKAKGEVVQTGQAEPDLPPVSGLEVET